MADIAKCFGTDCPLKDSCYRYTAPSGDIQQSYLGEVPYKIQTHSCDFYWPRGESEGKSKQKFKRQSYSR